MKYHYQLHIASPCHEEWDNMQPNEMGRYCDSCQKTVIDFSKMTEIEIGTFLHLRQGQDFCGNMELSQGQKNYTFIHTQRSDSPVKRYVMALFAGMIALPSAVFSQNGEIKQARVHDSSLFEMFEVEVPEPPFINLDDIRLVPEKTVEVERPPIAYSPNLISGRLINAETGLPIKYATVSTSPYYIEHLLQRELDALAKEVYEIEETHKDSQRLVEKQKKRIMELNDQLTPYKRLMEQLQAKVDRGEFGLSGKTDENGYFQFYLPAEITEGQITLEVKLEDEAVKDDNGKPKYDEIKQVRNLAIRFLGGTYYKEIKVKVFADYNPRMMRGLMVSPRPILVDE
ncbi:MAG: hypothetical protein ACKVTZ_08905 [Bacteroidia bacterium]